MTYFSILADFQNSGANVQKLCFYLLIHSKDLLDRSAVLSDNSQISSITLELLATQNVKMLKLFFCLAGSTQNVIKMLKTPKLILEVVNGQKVLQIDPKGLFGVLKGKNRVFVHWHRNSESLREC